MGGLVSFEVRRARKVAAGILVRAATAVPCTCLSQPALESVADDAKHQIAERILEEQSEHGPYSIDLLDPLRALGLLYQESGQHDFAAAALEQALQVVRANYGLRSLDQAPVIRQAIQNEEARGNSAAAWDLEQALLTLARGHSDDLRTIPIHREVGDKRMDVLRRYVAGEFPPQVILGCYYEPLRDLAFNADRNCYAGSRRVAAQAILADAWQNYDAAIRVFLKSQLYSSDELRELEMLLVGSSYQHGHYAVGRRSLRRLIAYDVANSEPLLIRIKSLVRMVDWDLLAGANESALQAYAGVHALLEREEVDRSSIDEIFSPKVPVLLPTFVPHPLVSEETLQSMGYVDVAFDVTKYGAARRVEILDATENATKAARDDLVRLIRSGRFRPRVTDGQFLSRSPVVVRYYLNEQQTRGDVAP